MELVSMAKEVIQNVAEQAASYKLGQSALRSVDRALWVVEKCARWAVPPPLDQDERPQPELVRPLPWVFFLPLLVTLRVARESMSLVNLVLGKPPLRSADVVMYIQSKRRYLRTLKYQGSRIIRARSGPQREPWYSGLHSLFEFTMCFRRSYNYGNNNTTRVSNNDEVMVVKRSKRVREPAPAAPAASDPMERLIEKMMVNLEAESDEDSSFTLTNATRSDRSDLSECDQDTLENHTMSTTAEISLETVAQDNHVPINNDVTSSTPEKAVKQDSENSKPLEEKVEPSRDEAEMSSNNKQKNNSTPEKSAETNDIKPKAVEAETSPKDKAQNSEPNNSQKEETNVANNDTFIPQPKSKVTSPKQESAKFIQNELCSPTKAQSKTKIANGRSMSAPNKKKGAQSERRDGVPLVRVSPPDNSF